MKVFNLIELMREQTSRTNTWGLYLSVYGAISIEELQKAVPFLEPDHLVYLTGNPLVLIVDTEKEMLKHYNQIVDNDILSVYAVTCNNKGVLQNENI